MKIQPMAFVVGFMVMMSVLAFGQSSGVIDNPEQVKAMINKSEFKKLPEWQKLVDALAAYDADYITATNKIALVTDAKTQAALNKVLNLIEDQNKAHAAVRKLLVELSR